MTGDWIDKSAQPPCKDANGCTTVLAWHVYCGVILQHYVEAARNPYITHWMPLPEPPRSGGRITMTDKEIVKALRMCGTSQMECPQNCPDISVMNDCMQ